MQKNDSFKVLEQYTNVEQTYCPYCAKTKQTIGDITKDAYILELDESPDGGEIQEALLELTGQRTVPNVFIGGEHIGGNSDVQQLKSSGKLDAKIKAVLQVIEGG